MTQCSTQLLDLANGQIAELHKLLSNRDEDALILPCPGRENLGDGSVGATARHLAHAYQQLARFIQADGAAPGVGSAGGHRHHQQPHHHRHDGERAGVQELQQQLSAAVGAFGGPGRTQRRAIRQRPARGSFRYCDGRRTLEQAIASVLRHQQHLVDAVKKALA
jgi:hypothetical protein